MSFRLSRSAGLDVPDVAPHVWGDRPRPHEATA